MMDGGEATEPGELTPVSVRRQLLALEKAIDENRRLRTKFPTDPTKYAHALLTFRARSTWLTPGAFPQIRRLGVHAPRGFTRPPPPLFCTRSHLPRPPRPVDPRISRRPALA